MASALVDGILALVFGLLILAYPKMLRFLVGGYFVIIGVLHLINFFF